MGHQLLRDLTNLRQRLLERELEDLERVGQPLEMLIQSKQRAPKRPQTFAHARPLHKAKIVNRECQRGSGTKIATEIGELFIHETSCHRQGSYSEEPLSRCNAGPRIP